MNMLTFDHFMDIENHPSPYQPLVRREFAKIVISVNQLMGGCLDQSRCSDLQRLIIISWKLFQILRRVNYPFFLLDWNSGFIYNRNFLQNLLNILENLRRQTWQLNCFNRIWYQGKPFLKENEKINQLLSRLPRPRRLKMKRTSFCSRKPLCNQM